MILLPQRDQIVVIQSSSQKMDWEELEAYVDDYEFPMLEGLSVEPLAAPRDSGG